MNKSPSAMLDTTGGGGMTMQSPSSNKKNAKYKIYLHGQQSQAKLPNYDPN